MFVRKGTWHGSLEGGSPLGSQAPARPHHLPWILFMRHDKWVSCSQPNSSPSSLRQRECRRSAPRLGAGSSPHDAIFCFNWAGQVWGIHVNGCPWVLESRGARYAWQKRLNLRLWPKDENHQLTILLRPDLLLNRGCSMLGCSP